MSPQRSLPSEPLLSSESSYTGQIHRVKTTFGAALSARSAQRVGRTPRTFADFGRCVTTSLTLNGASLCTVWQVASRRVRLEITAQLLAARHGRIVRLYEVVEAPGPSCDGVRVLFINIATVVCQWFRYWFRY